MDEKTVVAAFYLSNLIKDIYINDPYNKKRMHFCYTLIKTDNSNDKTVRSYLIGIHSKISFIEHDYEEVDAFELISYL